MGLGLLAWEPQVCSPACAQAAAVLSLTYTPLARAGSFKRTSVMADFEQLYQQGETMRRWFKKEKKEEKNAAVTLPRFFSLLSPPFFSSKAWNLNLGSFAESYKCLLI